MATNVLHSTAAAPNVKPLTSQLHNWLAERLTESSLEWIEKTLQQLQVEPSEKLLFTRFSAAARKLGKADLALSAMELQRAETLRPGWQPALWSVDQAARSLIVLTFPADDGDRYVSAVEKLFSAADMAEQVALYQTLPLFPHPHRFIGRAIEGLRANITAVFNAIALKNPYPADYFDESAWNQMVLKALFVDSQLSQIQGLDTRANAKLARMLSDYAHERWAAGRAVNPQLWRPLGYFAEGNLVADLERLMGSDQPFEQEAAALACAQAPTADAQALLDRMPNLKQRVVSGDLSWTSFSQAHP